MFRTSSRTFEFYKEDITLALCQSPCPILASLHYCPHDNDLPMSSEPANIVNVCGGITHTIPIVLMFTCNFAQSAHDLLKPDRPFHPARLHVLRQGHRGDFVAQLPRRQSGSVRVRRPLLVFCPIDRTLTDASISSNDRLEEGEPDTAEIQEYLQEKYGQSAVPYVFISESMSPSDFACM